MPPRFEPIAVDPSCDVCLGRRPAARLDVDAAYCISLQEQPERAAYAAAHFHAIGLCRQVRFYRPQRARNSERGCWTSHRAVAQHALAAGECRVLILEDDVAFSQPIADLKPRIDRALATLPADWWCLYLGHLPYQAYRVAPGLMRTRSTCAHAYIANAPLLEWLATTKPSAGEVPAWEMIGMSVDSAMSNLPSMYAVYPMMAVQRPFGEERVNTRLRNDNLPRKWNDRTRWRNLMIFHAPLFMERQCFVLSPWHARTLERNIARMRMGKSRAGQTIRASGLFDDDFYLMKYPDVAAADLEPLMHYVWHGAAEGRWPNASFDPAFYARQANLKPGGNALLHYVTTGRQRGYVAHPLDRPAAAAAE